MDTSYDSLDREMLKAEIRAAIAAGREVDPDMDEHLAHSAMTRYFTDRPKPPQIVEPPRERLTADDIILRSAALVLGGGVIVALIVAHALTSLWLVIPIMLMLMIVFTHRRHDSAHHAYRKMYKQAMRDEQHRYEDSHLRFKIEMMEAKRALLHGIIKGFNESKRSR